MRKQSGGWMSLVRVLLIVSLVISLLPAISSTVSADTGVVYIDEHGVTQTQDVKIIDQDNYGSYATLNAGWYLFRGTWQFNTTIATSGAVHIILEDGSDVTVTGSSNEAGIKVTNGDSLTIYAQSTGEGMGKLVANGSSYSAGIGGSDGSSIGTITINGGDITATGRSGGAGIGRGYSGAGGTITINGGDITAIGGVDGAGIGRGPSGSGTGPNIIVNGSYGYWTSNTVSAPSSMTGSGIFNGDSSSIFKGYVRYVKLISIEFITSPAITVTDPVTGAAPNATASVTGAVYFTAGAVSWTPTATVFEGSTPYTATVTLTADSGYLFASTLTEATINGNAATVTNNTGEAVTLSYSFAETATEITSPAITVTAPVTGATPNATASVEGHPHFSGRIWIMGGAGLLEIANTGLTGNELPGLPPVFLIHQRNLDRLRQTQLDWSIMCPGTMIETPGADAADRLIITVDRIPLSFSESVKDLSEQELAGQIFSRIQELDIAYNDVVACMLNNLEADSPFKQKQVGIAYRREGMDV